MAEHRRLKVLILASTCDGTDVGEAWSTYQWVSRLSQQHDITLLTYRRRSRPSAREQLPAVRVVEWMDLPFVSRFDRFNSMLKPGYVPYYAHSRRWLRRALSAGQRFDLAHQLSPLAMRYPSPAAGMGIPLIVGPLGGSLETPPGFVHEFGTAPWYTKLRGLDGWRLRHDPLLRGTLEGAAVVLGVAPYVRQLIDGLAIQQFECMSETGVERLPEQNTQRPFNSPLRLLFVGRIIRSKGVRDAIRAVSQLGPATPLILDIVGDGDDRAACERETHDLGVADRVIFHGRIARAAVEAFYRRADVFLFPSLREPSGNAVLEAMSHGLAMIVASNGGPGFGVSQECGYRIEPREPGQYAADLAAAIRSLAENPERIAAMGLAARKRIEEHYTWDRKIEWISSLYSNVMRRCGTRAPTP